MTMKQLIFGLVLATLFAVFYWLFFAYVGANLNWLADSLTWYWNRKSSEMPYWPQCGRMVVAILGLGGVGFAFLAGAAAAEKV